MEKLVNKLSDILSIKYKTYKNEFETMRCFFDKIPEKYERESYIKLPLSWLHTCENDEDIEFNMKPDTERIKESNDLRKEGNGLFTAKGTHRNVLGACRLYNDAIFAVLDCKESVEELALSFANRAMALQTFGYYQQAYDDCVCALEYGYPLSLRHKIVTRQAYCALKLKNLIAAKSHLNNLMQMALNENFQKQFHDLQLELEALQDAKHDDTDVQTNEIRLSRESQEIVDSQTEKGVYMRAKYRIPKNSVIFAERASAVVPVNDQRRICHQCCITSFIPYPCRKCRGRVVYCSLKCKREHSSIHDYECAAYRCQLFSHLGVAHLALRVVLDNGIFSIAHHLKTKSNTAEAWSSLSQDGDIWSNKKLVYSETLRMISHMDKINKRDVSTFASVSLILVSYLKHKTEFFDNLQQSSNCIDWELLVSALILRHIGQMMVNGHALTTLSQTRNAITLTDFYLLNDRIWTSPLHLKPGFLNTFGNNTDLSVQNFPYLSICNHSCAQSFYPRVSGRYLSTYALHDFNKGDEITNCYCLDSRKTKRSYRRQHLKSTYYFDCACEKCLDKDQDKDFNKYHQYRCDNKGCDKIFVPQLHHESLRWWRESKTDNVKINCPNCGCAQILGWYTEILVLEETMTQAPARRRAFQIFKSLETILLGLNEARANVANLLITEWFLLPSFGYALLDVDYMEIVEMLKYTLELNKSQVCVNSTEYVSKMVYLWDVMALGKYKCSNKKMDEMLFALSALPDDLKVIFLNYYNDYIKDKSIMI